MAVSISLAAACTGATPAAPGPTAASPTAQATLAGSTASPTAAPALQPMTPTAARARPTATATPEGRLEITIGDYYFYPQTVTVTVGTTITWTPVGVLYHTIASRDTPPAFWGATGGVGTRAFRFTFNRPGIYAYHCDYHPGAMDAWVVVLEES